MPPSPTSDCVSWMIPVDGWTENGLIWPNPSSKAKSPGWREMLDVVPASAEKAGAPQAW